MDNNKEDKTNVKIENVKPEENQFDKSYKEQRNTSEIPVDGNCHTISLWLEESVTRNNT